jgi:hypothetical protein
MPPLSTTSKTFLVLLVLLAASEFVVRGPLRFFRAADFNDFISPYVQSRALIQGLDPYSPEVLVQLWPVTGPHRLQFLAKDLADGTLIAKRGIPTAYPLTAFFLLAPIAMLPWPVAHLAWLTITAILTLGVTWSLLSLVTREVSDWRSYVFVAFALALAPLHTGFAAGSVVIATVALCGIALAREQSGNVTFAGVLLGIAVCLKPQIGLPFLAYYLLRRRWRLCGIAGGVVFAAAVLAMGRLAVSGTPWLQNYRTDNRVLLVSGILADLTERNPLRFSLINLQVLFYAIWHQAGAANAFAIGLSTASFVIWVVLLLRSRRESDDALLAMSAVAVLSLLPVYHRFYDAFLLIFPLCWSLREFSGPRRQFARGTLVLMLPFLVPGGSALEEMQRGGRIPDALTQSWFWNSVLMPHEIWCLLFLGVLLLWCMASKPAQVSAQRTGAQA